MCDFSSLTSLTLISPWTVCLSAHISYRLL